MSDKCSGKIETEAGQFFNDRKFFEGLQYMLSEFKLLSLGIVNYS